MEIQSTSLLPNGNGSLERIAGVMHYITKPNNARTIKRKIPQNYYTHLPSSLIPTPKNMGLMYEPNQHWIADIKTHNC